MRARTVASVNALRGGLPESGGVYLLLDGARFEDVHRFIYQMDELPEYEPLYRGTFFAKAHEVSPCLVKVSGEKPEMLDWFFSEGAAERKAVLITSGMNLQELAGHFRKYLEARLPSRKIVLFRYYDPGILHALIPFGAKPQVAGMLAPCSGLAWNLDGVFYELADRTDAEMNAAPLEGEQVFEFDDEIYAAMSAIARKVAIRRNVREFAANAPKLYAFAGEGRAHEFIELAWRKADHYNMTAEREINGLIILMTYLGCGFDSDPLYPWARFELFPDKVPSSSEDPESWVALKDVYARFISLYQQTDDDSTGFRESAMQRMASLAYIDLAAIQNPEGVLQFLRRIYPERYDLLPPDALHGEFMALARVKSNELGIDTWAGCALLALLMFMFGSFVNLDPLYSGVMDKIKSLPDRRGGKEAGLLGVIKELAAYMMKSPVETDEAEVM